MLYPLLLRRWFQATAILPLTPYLWLWEHSQKRCKTIQEAVKEWPESVTRACGCAVLGKVKDVPPPLLSSHLGHSRHQSCHWAAASNCCQLPAPQPTTNTRVPHRTLVAYSGLAHMSSVSFHGFSSLIHFQMKIPAHPWVLSHLFLPADTVEFSVVIPDLLGRDRATLCANFPHCWKEHGLVARQLVSSLARSVTWV